MFHRGRDFRTDYMELSALKAIFTECVTLALTATAPPHLVLTIQNNLSMKQCAVIKVSPNRENLYLSVQKRLQKKFESYDTILKPIAIELNIKRELYPMTIIYMKLQYCGYAYKLFEQLIENPYVQNEMNPKARLFSQFHAESTHLMKEELLDEIKSSKSRARVIFATTALGMGVNAPYITNIIHITPPGSLESYIQEIGRAGRSGLPSQATLYYNNSDISENITIVDKSMKYYCKNTNHECLRDIILNYFGFRPLTQKRCCSICEDISMENKEHLDKSNSSLTSATCPNNLIAELCKKINEVLQVQAENCSFLYDTSSDHQSQAKNIVENIENIKNERDLLSFGVWDENVGFLIYTMLQDHMNSV